MQYPKNTLHIDSSWEGWNLNNIEYPGNIIRTPEQNKQIVDNIQRLMDQFAATVNEGLTPDAGDIFWMDKIVTAVEQGEKLTGWGKVYEL